MKKILAVILCTMLVSAIPVAAEEDLAADAGREGETTGASVEVGDGEGNGGIEVVPCRTRGSTLREFNRVIGSLHFVLGQMQAAVVHVGFPLLIGYLAELGDLVAGLEIVLEFCRSGCEGELGFLFSSGFSNLFGSCFFWLSLLFLSKDDTSTLTTPTASSGIISLIPFFTAVVGEQETINPATTSNSKDLSLSIVKVF